MRLQFRGIKKRLYISLVERPIMQRATMLIALTAAEEQSYRALGVKTPCRIIPNGIDVAAYRVEPGRSLEALGLDPTALLVLFMARLHPLKGAERLIQAFLQIHRRFPQTVLVIAGPDEWGETARYRDLVRQAGVGERVFFPGMVQGDLKLDLLARADLFCLPSDGEGFSMAVLEALASGTAVLLSPGCHFPGVERAGAGKIAAPDPDSLAATLTEILTQPDRLQIMGECGRDLVSRDYSWDRITAQLIDAYHTAQNS
jgi:glycosyltransferase involved in cell wall biosynthesis